MNTKTFWLIFGIFFTGVIAGGISQIALMIGFSVSSTSFLMNIFGNFCSSIKILPNSDNAFTSCNWGFIALSIIVTILGFLGIFKTVSELGNIFKGIFIYILGWLAGYFFIMMIR